MVYADETPRGASEAQPTGFAGQASSFLQLLGAAVSLALVVGVGFWGYKLVARDVSGIPVVRALEGDSREAPELAGGEIAQNTGLSVNAVAAEGEAAAPGDRLVLAPVAMDLADDDLELTPMSEAGDVNPDGVAAALAIALEVDEAPASPRIVEEPVFEVIPASVPGLTVSPRPVVRQVERVAETLTLTNIETLSAPATVDSATLSSLETIDLQSQADALPQGTRLVQLGSFTSPEVAAEEWAVLQLRFGAYLDGRGAVIQEGRTGDQTFYRLRADGFDTIADARRFCTALVSEGAECVPVVTR